MRLYYTDRKVLFGMCAGGQSWADLSWSLSLLILDIEGNELFYAMLYLCHFTYGPYYLFSMLAIACFPVAILKSAIALLQGYLAATNLVGVDLKEREERKKD